MEEKGTLTIRNRADGETSAAIPPPETEIDGFEDFLQGEKSIGQIIDDLGQELLITGFRYMDKLRKGQLIDAALEVKQVEMQKQFKFLKSIYTDMVKMNRITDGDKPNEDFNGKFLEKVKNLKSSIGNIVRNTSENQHQ